MDPRVGLRMRQGGEPGAWDKTVTQGTLGWGLAGPQYLKYANEEKFTWLPWYNTSLGANEVSSCQMQ